MKGQAQVFLAGPPLVKMATGEVVEAEELGGAETHANITGLADQIATDEYAHPFWDGVLGTNMLTTGLTQSERRVSG